jgi:hypothetical protein
MRGEELKIKIIVPKQEHGDADLFQLFDFLLIDKIELIENQEVEINKSMETLL